MRSVLRTDKAKAPVAHSIEHWREIHNERVADNYYWMKDYFSNGPESERVLQYLHDENDYTDKVMSDTRELQQHLFDEMKARIKERDEDVPVFKNGYFYYTRTEEGKQYFKYCRKKGSLDAAEEILLDVDEMSDGHEYFDVSGFNVSPNNTFIVYGVDEKGRRQYTLYIKDLMSGELFSESILETEGYACWTSDSSQFYYVAKDPLTLLPYKVMRHRLRTDIQGDVSVYVETDSTNYLSVSQSKNRQYFFINSRSTLSSETLIRPATSHEEDFKVFQPRVSQVLYMVHAIDDRFLIHTNVDSSLNFCVMQCPLGNTERSAWSEFIAHRADVLIEGVSEFKDFVVLDERQDGLPRIRVLCLPTSTTIDASSSVSQQTNAAEKGNSRLFLDDYVIEFDEASYMSDTMYVPEYSTSVLRYAYTSLVTPYSTIDFDMQTRQKTILKQTEVVGGYDATEYVTERLYAVASDGTRIPISLVYKREFARTADRPLLLQAYGSYGISSDPYFSSSRLTLLNRGFAFAIAHIRGGEEMGRSWYEDGKLLKKKNTFSDFISCAEFLIQKQYTSPAHLYAEGGSAGGLLMGVVINDAPQLWNGILANVPFVDVVNTMLDESIPLTTNEYDEWGNPNDIEYYSYMKSYSPYENISRQNYPNMLVIAGLHDSQVQYFEPAKWVAKLRSLKTSGNVILLLTNMDYGHGGASGRFDYLKEVALCYAFLFALEGIEY